MLSQQQNRAIYDLQGKTLQVYLYLMRKNGPSGIREIQRDLKLSSPSVANYQVEKLLSLGLVDKDEYGRYFLLRRVHVPSLKGYINIGRFLLPRLMFYAVFFTAFLLAYLVLNANSLNALVVVLGSTTTTVFWYESFRVLRTSPIIRIDLYVANLLTEEGTKAALPYLALATGLVLISTIGFEAFSDLLGEFVNEHPEIYDIGSIDPHSAFVSTETYPADKISESVSLAKEKVSFATREDAYGPGVPVLRESTFSTVVLIFPFVAALTTSTVFYAIARTMYKE